MCDVLHYITMRERPSAILPAENGDGDRLRGVLINVTMPCEFRGPETAIVLPVLGWWIEAVVAVGDKVPVVMRFWRLGGVFPVPSIRPLMMTCGV